MAYLPWAGHHDDGKGLTGVLHHSLQMAANVHGNTSFPFILKLNFSLPDNHK